MQHLEPLISAQELAGYLDVPVKTLYAWRYHSAEPPAFRVGRRLRYRRSDVQRWIEQRIDTAASGSRVTGTT